MRPDNPTPDNQQPRRGRPVDGFVLPRVQPGRPPRPQTSPVSQPAPTTSASVSTATSPSSAHAAHTPETHYDHQLPAPEHHELLASGLQDETAVPAAKKKRSVWKWVGIIFGVLILLVAVAAGLGYKWYVDQLTPVGAASSSERVRVTIIPGSTPSMIGELLQEKGLVRNADAFTLYTHITDTKGKLQAGTYLLQTRESVPQIVDHLVSGKVDEFNLTFLPGETIEAHKKAIVAAGYSAAEVDAAFSKNYDHPVLATKPADADLEGYIFGETYRFSSAASVEDIVVRALDELQKQVTQYNLVATYKKQNLSLYQGITLASIIQREVSSPQDMRQVSQIFQKRLKDGMPLGADATFVYAAKKAGQTPRVDFPSPYNTRVHKGLPPGPIASPGSSALQAVANPALGDFVYFVSGDDGRSHFARTLAEHEANTRKYCQKNCALF